MTGPLIATLTKKQMRMVHKLGIMDLDSRELGTAEPAQDSLHIHSSLLKSLHFGVICNGT